MSEIRKKNRSISCSFFFNKRWCPRRSIDDWPDIEFKIARVSQHTAGWTPWQSGETVYHSITFPFAKFSLHLRDSPIFRLGVSKTEKLKNQVEFYKRGQGVSPLTPRRIVARYRQTPVPTCPKNYEETVSTFRSVTVHLTGGTTGGTGSWSHPAGNTPPLKARH